MDDEDNKTINKVIITLVILDILGIILLYFYDK
jgi:hypothetical protein